MSFEKEEKGAEVVETHETPQKSKSAKRRAKKSQKKAVAEQNANDSVKLDDVKKMGSTSKDTSDSGQQNAERAECHESDENETKSSEEEEPKKMDPVEKIIPKIQRFDINGKPLRNIAGNGTVHLGDITPHNVVQLKKLNEAVFPILYNDKFYVDARVCGELGQLAYYNDVVVGAVCCRIDDISDEKSLYIMTLGTLAAYRQIGIGTVLIDYVLKLCKKLEEIKTVYLHVQVNNQNAVHFYEKHGFTNDGVIEDYYRINPRDAFLLLKRIRD